MIQNYFELLRCGEITSENAVNPDFFLKEKIYGKVTRKRLALDGLMLEWLS